MLRGATHATADTPPTSTPWPADHGERHRRGRGTGGAGERSPSASRPRGPRPRPPAPTPRGCPLPSRRLCAPQACHPPISNRPISTINPQWVYDEHTHQQHRTGFQADTTLIIDTTMTRPAGRLARCRAGCRCNHCLRPELRARGRHRAAAPRARAVRCRMPAAMPRCMAVAAGGTLGALLQINTGSGPSLAAPGHAHVRRSGGHGIATAGHLIAHQHRARRHTPDRDDHRGVALYCRPGRAEPLSSEGSCDVVWCASAARSCW
jgi:hypothetical protein